MTAYVYEFTQTIDLHVPRQDRTAMNVALNLHHAGKAVLDAGELPEPVHTEAAYASHRVQRIDVRVGVTAHGELRLIGAEDVALLREVVRQTVRLHHDSDAVVSEASADVTIQTARVALRGRP